MRRPLSRSTSAPRRLAVAALLAPLSLGVGVGCGKDKAAAKATAKAAASPAKKAAPAAAAPAPVAVAAKPAVDPVPTAPAPGEKVPAQLDNLIDPANPPVPKGSLAAELRARTAAFKKKAPKAVQAIVQGAVNQLAASAMLGKALQLGAVAPDFELPDATGKTVKLSALLKDGPVVLAWYRGGWCPYCNIMLRRYSKMLPELQMANARLVVVSPDKPDKSLSTKQKLKLPMTVLSDVGLRVARSYGLVYTLPPKLKKIYDKKFKLESRSGLKKGELPLAATYVIGQDGKVAFAFLDPDYRRRAEPTDLIAAVQALAAKKYVPPTPPDAAPAAAAPAAKQGAAEPGVDAAARAAAEKASAAAAEIAASADAAAHEAAVAAKAGKGAAQPEITAAARAAAEKAAAAAAETAASANAAAHKAAAAAPAEAPATAK